MGTQLDFKIRRKLYRKLTTLVDLAHEAEATGDLELREQFITQLRDVLALLQEYR